MYDCWSRVLRRGIHSQLTATVPVHGNALLAVCADAGHLQLVFSDRHVAQGGIGLDQLVWDVAARTLSGIVYLVENDATELVVAVPESFVLASVLTDEGVINRATTNNDGTLWVGSWPPYRST